MVSKANQKAKNRKHIFKASKSVSQRVKVTIYNNENISKKTIPPQKKDIILGAFINQCRKKMSLFWGS